MKACIKCVAEKSESDYCWHDVTERFGLEGVASFNDPNASYTFDEFCIWKRTADGSLFYAQDSGCSCPSPFEQERFPTINELSPITPNSWETFIKDFAAYAGQRCEPYNEAYTKKFGARWVEAHIEAETVDKVRALLYVKEAAR